jgi:hypothetical protein
MMEPFTIHNADGSYRTIVPNPPNWFRITYYQLNGSHNPTSSTPEHVRGLIPAAEADRFDEWLLELEHAPIADELAGAIGMWARGGREDATERLLTQALETVRAAKLAAATLAYSLDGGEA